MSSRSLESYDEYSTVTTAIGSLTDILSKALDALQHRGGNCAWVRDSVSNNMQNVLGPMCDVAGMRSGMLNTLR
jgi:hypothetical protein